MIARTINIIAHCFAAGVQAGDVGALGGVGIIDCRPGIGGDIVDQAVSAGIIAEVTADVDVAVTGVGLDAGKGSLYQ